jgi:hypothetical protein
LSEYEDLLERRGLLASHFSGRQEEINELEHLLEVERKAVIINVANQHPAVIAEPPVGESGEARVWKGDSLRTRGLCPIQEVSAIGLTAGDFEVTSDVVEESVFLVLEQEPQPAAAQRSRIVMQ